MPAVIWIDSDADEENDSDVVEFVEPPTPRKPAPPLAGPSRIVNTQRQIRTPHKKRQRTPPSDSDVEIIDTPRPKIQKSKQIAFDYNEDHAASEEDRRVALALQKKWEEEDELARKQAAETEEMSLRLIERLQKMDQDMAEKRQRLAQSKDVPDDGIVFKVVIDADGKTLEGDDDPDNAAHLDLVKHDFEKALAGGMKLKTVTWFVNAKLEARFEAAKAVLDSFGIDTTERNLFHGTAATNIEPILKNGFLIPGISPGVAMVHGAACGIGIYLATDSGTSLGYTQGGAKMFMCRVITGRSSNQVSQAIPCPLGHNDFESWSGPGVYVSKYVELVVPRYVVEFDNPYQNLYAQQLARQLAVPALLPFPAVAPALIAPLPPPPRVRKKRAPNANPKPPSKRVVKGKGKAKQVDETEA